MITPARKSTASPRVRVASPAGSVFDGRTGVVTTDIPESSTVMVLLDAFRGVRGTDIELPFGRSELVAL